MCFALKGKGFLSFFVGQFPFNNVVGKGMLKSDIGQILADKHPQFPSHLMKQVLDSLIDDISKAIQDGGRVEIRGFGTFSSRTLNAKVGRNPKSGISVPVGERVKIHFKPGKGLKNKLNP